MYALITSDLTLKGAHKKLTPVGNLRKLLVYKSCPCHYTEGTIFFFRESDYYMGKYERTSESDIMHARSIIMLTCKSFVSKAES